MHGHRKRMQLMLLAFVPIVVSPLGLDPIDRNTVRNLASSNSIQPPLSVFDDDKKNRRRKQHLVSVFSSCGLASLFLSLQLHPVYAADLGSDILLSSTVFGDADLRFFLAGGICAAFSHGITTPIDVIKTRQQVDTEKYGAGVLDAAKIILQEEGAKALLKGLGPTVVGYGIEGAAKFGFYESLKPAMSRLLDLENLAIPYLIASVIAGAAASIMLCPLERTRIRLVTDPNFASNLLTGIPLLIKESGITSLFWGCPAMLSKQVPYTFGKQVSFDEVAKYLYSIVSDPSNPLTKLEVSFVSAFIASISACLLSQPGDVILTDTYSERGTVPLSFSNVTKVIYDRQGFKGFYSGLTARIFHVGVIITSQLLLYDYVKQALGLPATGSS
ncbi:mitochondrial carrier protein [Nitzschia inconspicua]|uniref:Mitochondrial carrier protein n=1 Tax=Nitzschia inconspicua TaxID=303405 RepID=A0A9K3PYH8_9STRA|nr:mitochondrial carrier protein [Nitzschia inconspicua]